MYGLYEFGLRAFSIRSAFFPKCMRLIGPVSYLLSPDWQKVETWW
ncbi:hypothetical protein Q1J52_20490 [Pseudomonas lijiangensis]